MYSTHTEGKSVVAEKFIRTLKTEIYKYINKLDYMVKKCNNTYHDHITINYYSIIDSC